MLSTLSIKNIALISETEIDFAGGLNILTGETGAGKSIIIDSLNFVLGARADKTLIRHGESEGVVEAEFTDVNSRVKAMLDEYEIDCEEDGLIITRKMTIDGKNTCRINGVKLTVSALREIAGALVDIYGQNENSILLNSNTHIDIIDSFGGSGLANQKAEYEKYYRRYRQILSAVKKYSSMQDNEDRLDLLAKQIEEIREFGVTVGEEEKLQKLCDSYDNAEEIRKNALNAYSMLAGDSDVNASDLIARAVNCLEDITEYCDGVTELIERLESARIEIEDVADSVDDIADSTDIDEYEAGINIARLKELHDLEGKYGNTESDILAYLDRIEQEYDELGGVGIELDKLSKEMLDVYAHMKTEGIALSKMRRECADKFGELVVSELCELGMPNTTFYVDIKSLSTNDEIDDGCSIDGFDTVEFLISPNRGEPLKPLGKIISGGEMSRFMLAIKKISSELDGVNVMVFDEIDTGISGKIAQVVANKLYDISISRQVLAVTHLPQLASMADNHYLIEKTSDETSTVTNVRLLDYDGAVNVLTSMIGGVDDSEFALMHARKLKDNANAYKENKQKA